MLNLTGNTATLSTREAIERLHNEKNLCQNLTEAEQRYLLTLAEHCVIRLGEMEWLDEETYDAVKQFATRVDKTRKGK
jgi:hypothetical protein